ncbi:hypothetical protein [Bacillus sp. AFS002410]|nr:hypothetical protein [Bacillus sp. AFS002410]
MEKQKSRSKKFGFIGQLQKEMNQDHVEILIFSRFLKDYFLNLILNFGNL